MSAREELRESLLPVDRHPAPGEAEAMDRLIDAYRAEVLREVRREILADLAKLPEAESFSYGAAYQRGMDWAARVVDHLITL